MYGAELQNLNISNDGSVQCFICLVQNAQICYSIASNYIYRLLPTPPPIQRYSTLEYSGGLSARSTSWAMVPFFTVLTVIKEAIVLGLIMSEFALQIATSWTLPYCKLAFSKPLNCL